MPPSKDENEALVTERLKNAGIWQRAPLAQSMGMPLMGILDGEAILDSVDQARFQIKTLVCFPLTFVELTFSGSDFNFRRSWQHIREYQTGSRLVWFVKKGLLSLTRSRNTMTVAPGQIAFLNANAPFRVKALRGTNDDFEAILIAVPIHVFLTSLDCAENYPDPLTLEGAHGEVAKDVFELLREKGRNMSTRLSTQLTNCALSALGNLMVTGANYNPSLSQAILDRFRLIKTYIIDNCGDSHLCSQQVAIKYGISERYLCAIFKKNNTSFSKILWENRLEKARILLQTSNLSDVPVSQIAEITGFKSAAHFSRLFRSSFHLTPTAFRAAALRQEQAKSLER